MKHRCLIATLMLATSSCLAFADDFQNRVQFSVPEIGSGVGLIDQHKERMIGEKVYRQVQKQMPVLHDPWLEDQLYFSFSHILSQTQLAQEPVGLVLINDPQINAFAVPGGLFALNTGMITAAKRMDEVASVMAHEIAHVTQRHYSRSQEAFKGQGLLSMAGILVGALVASQADGDVGAAVMMGSQAAMVDRQLSYSRDQEREADRIGMQYMYAAGYNPHGMADFFEIMHRATSRVSFIPDFWYTHPLTTERMSEARLRASQLPPQKSPLNDENFEVLRWYSKVLAGQTTEDELKLMSGRGVLAAEFALSKFYIQQGDFTKAQYFLNQAKARSSVGNSNLVVILQTDIYLGQKAYPLAHQAIRQSAVLMPENRALVLKQAEVLIRMGKPEQAQPLLQRFLRQNSRDVSALQLMFQAANAEPASPLKAVNVLRHRAELEFWTGNEEEAIKSMLHAERLSKNNQAMSAQIQQRLKEMQQDRRYKI